MRKRSHYVERSIAEHQRIGGNTVTTGGKIARIIGTKVLPRSGMPVVRLCDVSTNVEFIMSYSSFAQARFSGVA